VEVLKGHGHHAGGYRQVRGENPQEEQVHQGVCQIGEPMCMNSHQCSGPGSGWIRLSWALLDPDPYHVYGSGFSNIPNEKN